MKLTLSKTIALLAVLVMAALTLGAASANAGALQASAELQDAAGTVIGFAHFTEDATGRVHISVHVKGLTPGLHGIHLHAVGSCSPTFAAAGGHHNPAGHQHGLDNPLGPHAGDLPNLVVNAAGVGHLKAITDRASLSAGATTLFDADGSALIIHASADDQVTDPTGNSGGRIVCGVITND